MMHQLFAMNLMPSVNLSFWRREGTLMEDVRLVNVAVWRVLWLSNVLSQ